MPNVFDLTPDPKVLIALTHTPMQPLDALCELIDNSMDSFQLARLSGRPVQHPLIVVDLPRPVELKANGGYIRTRDNGPGLTEVEAERAIRAGYSGNNPYDSLGLFGMGFNISTGKLGRTTRFFTTRSEVAEGIEVLIDLERLRESRSYQVPFQQLVKPDGFDQGTEIVVRDWWPDGNPNSGFVRKLVQYGLPTIRTEIGRRYASILRKRGVRITINGEDCTPFEHCVWADHRYVERLKYGKIPAVFRFNQVIHTQKRCTACNSLVPPTEPECPVCHGAGVRTIEERIEGWVGIQRFDDATDYGIDLIRNGRAIRVGEKSAFFEFTNELGRTIKDYPLDGPYGRIVGEVHLNHVPVDFLKQDFQRSSPEWLRAMVYIRGDSSLQPTQERADDNQSPVFKLFQGYRRVRTPGKSDLYMGYWDSGPKRISRDEEAEFRRKFTAKIPGFYEDDEWYKQVERADQRPVEELVVCPECQSENLKGRDRCDICNGILQSKTCLNPQCGKAIALMDLSCEHCGASQIPNVVEPWKCQLCDHRNTADDGLCLHCGSPRGTESPVSRKWLLQHANKSDELSIHNCSVVLADGTDSQPVHVVTYVTQGAIQPYGRADSLPLVAYKGEQVEIFVDVGHPLVRSYRIRAEQLIAAEVAMYVFESYRRLSAPQYQGQHSLTNLEWGVLNKYFSDRLKESDDQLRDDLRQFFTTTQERLVSLIGDQASEVYDELSDEQRRQLVENMLARGLDISKLGEMKLLGGFLRYVDAEAVVLMLRRWPEIFFDKGVWDEPYASISGLSPQVVAALQKRTLSVYLNCLEDAAFFLRYRTVDNIDPTGTQRCRASLEYLQKKLV